MMRLLLSLLLLLSFLQINAQTYPKVILPGDYPDPSIMRDGKDYKRITYCIRILRI
jgi:beta-xylosidase